MTDLNDHPFAPANVARESGAPSNSERAWLSWCARVEKILGHDLDGDETQGDSYSLDGAHDAWMAGVSPHGYAREVCERENDEAVRRDEMMSEFNRTRR